MAYKTYITDALVCGSRPSNTADKSYLLFTREAGMLYASAKSVREERSKHRYALQEFSYIRVTLVQGKAGWRITGTEALTNVYALQRTREARALVRNVIKLLRRLIQGEAPHDTLYEEVADVLNGTHTGREAVLEELLTLRVLRMLGYIAPAPEDAFLFEGPITETLGMLTDDTKERRRLLIENAFRESHL